MWKVKNVYLASPAEPVTTPGKDVDPQMLESFSPSISSRHRIQKNTYESRLVFAALHAICETECMHLSCLASPFSVPRLFLRVNGR